jgi:hypothetical protein
VTFAAGNPQLQRSPVFFLRADDFGR